MKDEPGHRHFALKPGLDSYTRNNEGAATFDVFDGANPTHSRLARELRLRLLDAGFSHDSVRRALGDAEPFTVPFARYEYLAQCGLPDSILGQFIRLFVLNREFQADHLARLLGTELFDFLKHQRVLVKSHELYRSIVAFDIYEDLLVTTDVLSKAAVWPPDLSLEDRVMYIGKDSIGLACVVPRDGCSRLLDLCCGSGVQALLASRFSKFVIGVDINPRALRFACFNMAANGIENVEFRLGNLFDPVLGETFDMIVANPPFVPTVCPSAKVAFRDGGVTGEDILKYIIRHCDRYLHEAGFLCFVSDIPNADSFSARLDVWCRSFFDVLVLLEDLNLPLAYAEAHCDSISDSNLRAYAISAFLKSLETLDIRDVAFGYGILQKTHIGSGEIFVLMSSPNVNEPVYEDVTKHFMYRKAIRRGSWRDAAVSIAADVRCRLDFALTGGALTNVELYSDRRRFVGRYALGADAYELILKLRRTTPLFSELSENEQQIVQALALRGLLVIS